MFSFNKGVLEISHGDSRARTSRSLLALSWSQAHWIVFGSSQLGDGVLQEEIDLFSLVCLDLIVKIR